MSSHTTFPLSNLSLLQSHSWTKILSSCQLVYICFRSSPELVSALEVLQPERSPAEVPAGTGGSASSPAVADGRDGPVEGIPSGVCQEKGEAMW